MRKPKKVDKSKISKALRDSDDDDDDDAHSASGSDNDNEQEPGRRSVREKSVPRGNQIDSDADD